MESVITPYFWVALWKPFVLKDPKYAAPIQRLYMVIIHSLPYFCLLVEFVFLNSIPLIWRHISGLMLVSFCYLLVNMSYVLSTGRSIYPGMDWKTSLGIILPVGIMIASIFIYYLLVKISNYKMKKLKYQKILEIFKSNVIFGGNTSMVSYTA
jgi:hypothetical protein